MSDLILPSFDGFSFERKRNPKWDTRIQQTAGGSKEIRANFDAYPRWFFAAPLEFLVNDLESSDYTDLMGFYLAVRGRTDTWLYDCPSHNSVTAMSLGTGDGVNKAFQLRLVHPYGFIEPVHQPKADIAIYVDAVLVDPLDYDLSATGAVTFKAAVAAPANNAALTWTGGYYHRCRFDAELPGSVETMKGIYEDTEFSFIGSPVAIL